LELFNINKLLYNFDYLFTINNIKGLRFYSLQEFMLYNESNDFESLHLCSNYNLFLIHMFKQNYKYDLFLKQNKQEHQDVNNDKILVLKDYEDLLLQKKIKNLKRKSAPTVLKNKKRKKKIIQILVETDLNFTDYNYDNEEENYIQVNEYGGVNYHKKVDLEVTKSESESESENENENENESESESNKKNILEIKAAVVGNVHKNLRQ